MTFEQLNYVIEVSKTGSINKAAVNLFVSQSSLSQAIQNLEKELGYEARSCNHSLWKDIYQLSDSNSAPTQAVAKYKCRSIQQTNCDVLPCKRRVSSTIYYLYRAF